MNSRNGIDRRWIAVSAAVVLVLLAGCAGFVGDGGDVGVSPTATPASTPTSTPGPTETTAPPPTTTPTPTSTPTETPTPEPPEVMRVDEDELPVGYWYDDVSGASALRSHAQAITDYSYRYEYNQTSQSAYAVRTGGVVAASDRDAEQIIVREKKWRSTQTVVVTERYVAADGIGATGYGYDYEIRDGDHWDIDDPWSWIGYGSFDAAHQYHSLIKSDTLAWLLSQGHVRYVETRYDGEYGDIQYHVFEIVGYTRPAGNDTVGVDGHLHVSAEGVFLDFRMEFHDDVGIADVRRPVFEYRAETLTADPGGVDAEPWEWAAEMDGTPYDGDSERLGAYAEPGTGDWLDDYPEKNRTVEDLDDLFGDDDGE